MADLKIAYILNTYPMPSHSFIRREMQALERRGLDIHRLAMRGPEDPLVDPRNQAEAARTTYVLKAGGVRLLTGLLRLAVRSPGPVWSALRLALTTGRGSQSGVVRHLIYLAEAAWVTRYCADQAITHMHAHFGTNATTVAMLARDLGGPGYSFTTHGPEEFDAPQALSLGPKLDRSALAIAVSQFGRSQLCRWASFGTWDRIKVVHCGIETGAFAAPAPLPDGPLRLVSIGRLVEQKGQMVLIKAMARVRDQVPDVRVSLVGDGPMRAALERAIRDLNLQDHVTLAGWLDEAGVLRELNAAHGLVMPSFAEGLPMVVMEAMAAARPVISTYVAGIPELVLDGKTGWLVPAGDAGELSRAIVDMAHMPRSDLQAMGKAGRARVLDRHDMDREAKRLAAYFSEVETGAG